MIKSVLKLLLIVCLGVVVVFTYQTKGFVDIRWQGFSVSMKMGTFVLLVLLGTWILFYIFSFIKYLERLAKNLKEYWLRRHEAEGNRYIEESISALAGGMSSIALQKARKGAEILKNSLLAKWVYACVMKEVGAVPDDKVISNLIKSKNLSLAGYRLHMEQLLKQGDMQAAISEAEAAIERYPRASWLLNVLFKLFINQRSINKAMEIAKKLRPLDQADADLKIVLCYILQSRLETDIEKKIKYLQLAFEINKNNLVIALELSKLFVSSKRYKKAQMVIEAVWKYSRHSELGEIYLDILKELNSDDRISGALKLLEISNSSLEGYVVVIKTCIACEFYQKARYYLEKAIQANNGMSYKLFELRVELTLKDGAEKLDYPVWIKQVTQHKVFEGWECATCGNVLSQWEPDCIKCGNINSYFWQGEHERTNSFFAIRGTK
jgi:uncharacterized membrane-anchored protein